jgi:hypothetical protein
MIYKRVVMRFTTLPKIIGISGKFGTGKDTVAESIIRRNPEYELCPFAENVKHIVSIITGTTISEQYTRSGKAKIPVGMPFTIGKYQQIVGQGMRDLISPDVWVNATLLKSAEYKIIPDVRYPSEVKSIEEHGGIVIRLLRENLDLQDGRDPNHTSETALDGYVFDYVVENDSSIEDLNGQISKILSKYVT